jgi:hypothetical protein
MHRSWINLDAPLSLQERITPRLSGTRDTSFFKGFTKTCDTLLIRDSSRYFALDFTIPRTKAR